jgi:hypothetical protein
MSAPAQVIQESAQLLRVEVAGGKGRLTVHRAGRKSTSPRAPELARAKQALAQALPSRFEGSRKLLLAAALPSYVARRKQKDEAASPPRYL